MKSKVSGTVMIIIGLVGIGTSFYIQSQVAQGKEQVHSAQKKVDQGGSLFSLVPGGKQASGKISQPVQDKIEEGTQLIKKYERISLWLMVGGIALAVLGGASLLFSKKR